MISKFTPIRHTDDMVPSVDPRELQVGVPTIPPPISSAFNCLPISNRRLWLHICWSSLCHDGAGGGEQWPTGRLPHWRRSVHEQELLENEGSVGSRPLPSF